MHKFAHRQAPTNQMTSLRSDCYQTWLNKLDIVSGEGQRIVSVIDIDTGQSKRYSDGDVMEGHSLNTHGPSGPSQPLPEEKYPLFFEPCLQFIDYVI